MTLVHGLEHEMAQNKQELSLGQTHLGSQAMPQERLRDSLAMKLFGLLGQVMEDPEVK